MFQKGEAGLLEKRVLGKPKLNFLPAGSKGVKGPGSEMRLERLLDKQPRVGRESQEGPAKTSLEMA